MNIVDSSAWRHPSQWMKAISKKKRNYGYIWKLAPTRNGVQQIVVSAGALENKNKGYTVVSFTTAKKYLCDKVSAQNDLK